MCPHCLNGWGNNHGACNSVATFAFPTGYRTHHDFMPSGSRKPFQKKYGTLVSSLGFACRRRNII